MKTILLAIFFCPLILFGQKTHTVGPKETLFSIGRQYKIHPRELAEYNQIPYGSGLTIGQVIKIPSRKNMAPLTDAGTNPVSAEKKSTQPQATVKQEYENVAVYHTVTKKETLYQISKKNKVSIPDLKKWNRLSSDALKDGMQLVVGYKKQVKKTVTPSATQQPEKKNVTVEEVSISEVKPDTINTRPPVSKKVEEPVQPVKETPVPEKSPAPAEAVPAKMPTASAENVFKTEYDEQVAGKTNLKEKTGSGAIFKSGSGWDDGKYYCLYNQAVPGTIIRINVSGTSKWVYAKVLDVIPDMKQNEGLMIIISNAAAAKLGITESRYECSITY